MQYAVTFALLLGSLFSFAQTSIPQGTLVPVELTRDVNAADFKVGAAVPFKVSRDIMVNGVKVINANAVVHAVVTRSNSAKNGELRIDFLDVPTADGGAVKLSDCWIFTTAAENTSRKTKGAQFVAGTNKNCYTTTGKVDSNAKF